MATPARPMLRYHGGKWMLAPWIIAHFPPHRVYVEPFGGGAGVLLRKPRAMAEVYNDRDAEIVNLFRVMRDRGPELAALLELTPYSRAEFEASFERTEDALEQARRTVVRSYQGFGSNLTRDNRNGTPQRTGFRNYTAGDRSAIPAMDWRNYPDAVVAIVERLRGVVIENRHAGDVMAAHDAVDALHYVDPPYVHGTRKMDSGGSIRGYRYEMTDEDHADMADCLGRLKGMVVLSGYRCELYDQLFATWTRVDRHHIADGARPRIESLWLNRAAANAQHQQSFLDAGGWPG
jgi:DNA adenine methylase